MNGMRVLCRPGRSGDLRRTIYYEKDHSSQLLAAAGVSAAALALTACGGSSNSAASTSTAASSTAASAAGDAAAAANDPKVTLVYAEVNPLDTIVGQTATHFKEKVEELTGGSVVIDVQASGVLGSENDVLDAILGGSTSIDMSRISAFALTSYGCNKSKLLSIPFTFENRAHFWNFANSDLAPEFLNEPQELGLPVRGVFYGEEGFRHFFTVNPVSGIADFKGLKLRVSNDPVMNGMVEGLGANPTVVSFGELYSALQTKMVDADPKYDATYPWHKAYLGYGRKALSEYLGSQAEQDYPAMQKLINAFREGENEILLRKLGEEEADFHYEAGDFSDKRVLLIEWTHAGNPNLKGVDISVFLYSTPEETFERRKKRARNANTDTPLIALVLELEQIMLNEMQKTQT